jgi:hypothetical protein
MDERSNRGRRSVLADSNMRADLQERWRDRSRRVLSSVSTRPSRTPITYIMSTHSLRIASDESHGAAGRPRGCRHAGRKGRSVSPAGSTQSTLAASAPLAVRTGSCPHRKSSEMPAHGPQTGEPSLLGGGRCGVEAGHHRGDLCARRTLRDDLNALLGGQPSHPALAGLVDALCASERPKSIIVWKRSAKVQV